MAAKKKAVAQPKGSAELKRLKVALRVCRAELVEARQDFKWSRADYQDVRIQANRLQFGIEKWQGQCEALTARLNKFTMSDDLELQNTEMSEALEQIAMFCGQEDFASPMAVVNMVRDAVSRVRVRAKS